MNFKIIKIKWERSNLHIYLNNPISSVYLQSKNKQIALEFQKKEIIIPLTNIDEEMLDQGLWCLKVDNELVSINDELLNDLDDLSRIFYYRNGFYAYIVSFTVQNNVFYINVDFMMKNKEYRKYLRVQEGNNLKEKGKIVMKIIAIKSLNAIYFFNRLFKQKNTVLFLSVNSNELPLNLKMVYNQMPKKYNLKTYCHDDFTKTSLLSLLKQTYLIAISRVVIIENYTPILNFLNIGNNTKIIQLWHAGVGFKAVGYARFGKIGSPHPYHSSHRKYDYVIVDDEDLVGIYEEVFGINRKKIKAYGMPRLDNYFNKETILKNASELYAKYDYLKEKKIILFAPTYRGIGQNDAYYDFNQLDFNQINDFCQKNDFVFLIKRHPFITEKVSIKKEYKATIVDISTEDINKLIYITDILVTDYSSCVYEFSRFNRPIILFRYDKLQYEWERPMHTLNKIKSMEVLTFKELMRILNDNKNINIKDRFTSLPDYQNRSATAKIIKLIEKELDK